MAMAILRKQFVKFLAFLVVLVSSNLASAAITYFAMYTALYAEISDNLHRHHTMAVYQEQQEFKRLEARIRAEVVKELSAMPPGM